MTTETALQIKKIALLLGHPWKVSHLIKPCDWRHEIIDGSGRCLYFRVEGSKFKIMGTFPANRCEAHSDNYKTIGVSIARPARDIAADIKRRLLPHYLEQWPITVARYQERQAGQEKIELVTQALQRVAGGRIVRNGYGARTIYFTQGSADIWSNLDISLSLSKLTVEQAIKITAVLQE